MLPPIFENAALLLVLLSFTAHVLIFFIGIIGGIGNIIGREASPKMVRIGYWIWSLGLAGLLVGSLLTGWVFYVEAFGVDAILAVVLVVLVAIYGALWYWFKRSAYRKVLDRGSVTPMIVASIGGLVPTWYALTLLSLVIMGRYAE